MDRPAFDVTRARRAPRRAARRLHQLSDEKLIAESRQNEREAYGELYRRHSRAALVAARSFHDLGEPDDLVSEAFANIYEVLRSGAGPSTAFRPYLYVTIRNLATRRLREPPAETGVEFDELALDGAVDPAEAALERGITATAFRSLPDRWQTVLWYTEVERLTTKQAGDLMGLAPNAVAALSFRARAALREAWVQGHVDGTRVTGTHREVLAKLGGWSLGTLSERDERLVGGHLDTCGRCRLIAEELDDVSSRLAVILLPLVLGGGAALFFQRQLADGSSVAAAPRLQLDATSLTSLGVRRVALVGGASIAVVGAVVVIALSAVVPPKVSAIGDASRGSTQSGSSSPSSDATDDPSPVASGDPAIVLPVPNTSPSIPFLPTAPVIPLTPRSGTTPPATTTPPGVPVTTPSTPPARPTPSATPTAPPTGEPPPPGTLAAPSLTSPSRVLTRSVSSTITGTAPRGAAVAVSSGGAPAGSAEVGLDGTWSWTTPELAEGPTTFEFVSTESGSVDSTAVDVTVTRDTTAPQAPEVTSTWTATQTTPLALSGTAEPLSSVVVRSADGTRLAVVSTDATGSWSTGVLSSLSPATASLGLVATDAAGNSSVTTAAGPFAFTPVFVSPHGETYADDEVPLHLEAWPGSSIAVDLDGVPQGTFVVAADATLTLSAQSAGGGRIGEGDFTVTASYTGPSGAGSASAETTFTVARP